MKLGVRGKLFAASVTMIVTGGVTCGSVLRSELGSWHEEQIERELRSYAELIGTALRQAPPKLGANAATLDQLADRLGRSTGARVTVIDHAGRVLGDSELSIEALGHLDPHNSRPEVVAAMTAGRGISRRYSATLRADMLYVAIRVRIAARPRPLVVRVAMALSSIDRAIGKLQLLILAAGLVGLLIAVVISGVAAHLLTRPARAMVDAARAMARGEWGRRLDVNSSDEFGRIASSFNQIADELEHQVDSLAHERDRLRAVLEGMSDALIAVDADQRITLINSAGLLLLGLTEPPIDRPVLDVLRAPELTQLLSGTSRALTAPADPGRPSDGGVRSVEFDHASQRRVMATLSPVRAAGSSVVVLHDVTEMRRLETVRRDFVANVSHELRTPVAIIRANAETLLDGALDQPSLARQFLEPIHRHAERLSGLIADLLDISRIEAGQYTLEQGAVPIAGVIYRAIDALSGKAQQKKLSIDAAVDKRAAVGGDEKAIDQVLFNLLDNAVKYTPTGGAITIQTAVTGRDLRVEIADDGPGIPLRHRDRIFERFYRVDPGRSREIGGTGLGLSIVKHLIEAMNGVVGVEPNKPRGSVFWFTLPLRATTLQHGAVSSRALDEPMPPG